MLIDYGAFQEFRICPRRFYQIGQKRNAPLAIDVLRKKVVDHQFADWDSVPFYHEWVPSPAIRSQNQMQTMAEAIHKDLIEKILKIGLSPDEAIDFARGFPENGSLQYMVDIPFVWPKSEEGKTASHALHIFLFERSNSSRFLLGDYDRAAFAANAAEMYAHWQIDQHLVYCATLPDFASTKSKSQIFKINLEPMVKRMRASIDWSFHPQNIPADSLLAPARPNCLFCSYCPVKQDCPASPTNYLEEI